MTKDKQKLAFAGIALSGWFGSARAVRFSKGVTTSTSVSSYDRRFKACWARIEEGGYLLDKRPVGRDALVNGVLSGPMLDVDATETSPCPKPSDAMVAGMEGAFGGLLAQRAADETWRGLDRVPMLDYLAFWAALGARVGRRIGDHIAWADGEISPIR